MKHRITARDCHLTQFALFALFGFAFCYPPPTSAQSNTTRTRIHVADDTPDPALVAARGAMDHKDYAEAFAAFASVIKTAMRRGQDVVEWLSGLFRGIAPQSCPS